MLSIIQLGFTWCFNVGQNKVIEKNILAALDSIINSLSKIKDPLTTNIAKKLRETINVLENTPKPPIPTRKYIDTLSLLLRCIVRLKGIVEEYIDGKLMVEDLYKAVKEYENKVYLYTRVSSKERIKTHISMLMPTILIGLTLIYTTTIYNAFSTITINFVSILLIASILVLRQNTLVANILTAFASMILLASLIEKGFNPKDLNTLILTTIYVITLATSISYAHISHTTRSSKYLRDLEKTLKEILKGTVSKNTVPKARKDVVKLENMLKDVYKKLYGSKGEEYLRYKVTLLMISYNIDRAEALKKLYNEIKEIISREGDK